MSEWLWVILEIEYMVFVGGDFDVILLVCVNDV